MNQPDSNKKLHAWLKFLVELLSVRAGLHLRQSAQQKEYRRG